jgi:hypothetical protein
MVPAAFLSQMCALEFRRLYRSHHPKRVLCCNWNGRGAYTLPHLRPSEIWRIQRTIEGKLLPFTRSIVTQVVFLTFVNHINPFFLLFFPVRRLDL